MLTVLLALPLTMSQAQLPLQVVRLPPSLGKPPPCDPRPCLAPRPKLGPVYKGKFSVYHEAQIQCRVPPCPAAGAIVTLPDGTTMRVSRVTYAKGTPETLQLGADPRRRTIRFEGKLWITSSRSVAILAPVKASYDRNLPRRRAERDRP